jgi:hypothetical protein
MSLNDLRQMFKNKGLTDGLIELMIGEIKDLFNTIDINNDNSIDETEWSEFHRIFIENFEECDEDGNFMLD